MDSRFGNSRALAPAFMPSSVYSIPDLDSLDRISGNVEPGFTYARDNHPNHAELGIALALVESAAWGLATSSGMSAISATIIALSRQGGRVVASDRLYGRTTEFLARELPRFGITIDLIDTQSLNAVEAELLEPTTALFVETLSNPSLRVANVPELARITQRHGVKLIVDNTFATPVVYRPIEAGADLVIESLTKMIGGHSDMTLGAILGNDPALQKIIGTTISVWGMSPSPFDCWLALRGLPTLELRVRESVENAQSLAEWLGKQPGVTNVLYPGLNTHPDYELAGKQFRMGPANIITLELAGGRSAVNQFMRRAPGIPFCPSLGHFHTTCSHPASTSHRFVEVQEKERLGIHDGMLRLSVGIEPQQQIRDEILRGLS